MAFKNLYFLILISISSVFFKAQVNADFRYFVDKAFYNIYNDPDEGILFAQNLMVNDKSPEKSIIYQNVISQSYAFKGDYLNSLKADLGKQILPNFRNSSFFQFYFNYSRADQYQNLGLYEQSEKVIDQILKNQEFPNNPDTKVTLGKIYQLQALNFAINKKYAESLKFLKKK